MSGDSTVGRIEIDAIDVTLGTVTVLEGTNATIEDGRFVGLVGPNGAGKTTLLRTINGALSPDAGTVRVGGDAIAELPSREISRRVATVPQVTTLSFEFDVRDVVAMGRNPYRGRFRDHDPDPGAVDRALCRTATTDLAERPITAVSGGERQRVLLARALAQDTPVLLLDEPTANLDINHQIRTLELVRGLVDEENKTVLAAIHDLDLAARYCDDIALLTDGEIRAVGPPESVLTNAQLEDAFGARAVTSRHPITGRVLVTALDDVQSRDTHIHVVCGAGSGSELLYRFVVAGFDVSAGVLSTGDLALEAARALGIDTVTAEPFAPIDEKAKTAVEDRIRRADVTVLADVELTAGNVTNLEAAAGSDRIVVVEDRSTDERHRGSVDDVARRWYDRIKDRATVVDADDCLPAVAAAAGASPDGQSSPAIE